jgi:branched-chain amino acid transport system substrate-binding protein
MKRGRWTILALAAVAALSAVVAGCGSSDDEGSGGGGEAAALPASSCPTPIVYEGDGAPEYLIVSDLPLQGASGVQTIQMGKAIEFVLKQRGFKAGDKTVGYQACDDSTAQAANWDSAKCTQNGNAYVANEAVLGVIGTFNSGCAALMIPVLNNGAVAMISPANTRVGLTIGGAGVEPGEPDKYYPTGKRNYTRVVAADHIQGAALATYAQELGLKNVYVLNDGELYGVGLAGNFVSAAGKLNLKIAGDEKWDVKATSYEPLGNSIKATGADGVFLAGTVNNQAGKLVKDLRAVLGNDFPVLSGDGFTPIDSVVKDGGAASEDVYVTVAGAPIDQLTGAGKTFVDEFGATLGGTPVEPYSAYAAAAANIMLDAIAESDGTRQSVVDKMFAADVKGGILGDFTFDDNGDTTAGGVTVYQIKGGKLTTIKVVTPAASLTATG